MYQNFHELAAREKEIPRVDAQCHDKYVTGNLDEIQE